MVVVVAIIVIVATTVIIVTDAVVQEIGCKEKTDVKHLFFYLSFYFLLFLL